MIDGYPISKRCNIVRKSYILPINYLGTPKASENKNNYFISIARQKHLINNQIAK